MAADAKLLVEESIELAHSWLVKAAADTSQEEQSQLDQLNDLVTDPEGISFAMNFIDHVARPDNAKVAAAQLDLMATTSMPRFLSPVDRLMFAAGARLAKKLPRVVVPLALRRMRAIVGNLVVDASPKALDSTLDDSSGFRHNINLLGEAVLGDSEATKRFKSLETIIKKPNVDYVSVKISAVAPKLNHWDHQGSFERISNRLAELFRVSKASVPQTFVNLDMEEYRDLELTIQAFTSVLDRDEFTDLDAGIVLQTYLPDSFDALKDLVRWATQRVQNGGGSIKIRLVKGANLSMEKVEAEIHGWTQAPYSSKAEVDANYKKCLDWVLTKDRTMGVRIGVASHNLFDVAWASLLAAERRVADRVEFEMLHAMAPAQARVVDQVGDKNLLVYTPIVAKNDFDVAIGYLFRRLEENSIEGNFLRSLLTLKPESPEFDLEAAKFSAAVEDRLTVSNVPRRTLQRPATSAVAAGSDSFINEPDSDPVIPSHREWAEQVAKSAKMQLQKPKFCKTPSDVKDHLQILAESTPKWQALPTAERALLIKSIGNQLAARRGDLIGAMMAEANKTFAQADSEVSEAIDFALYYGFATQRLGQRLSESPELSFDPIGTVTVVPPWNFPVAIPAGGVIAALAAGNTVLFKPAPQTINCARIVAECIWKAGVGKDVVRFLPMKDGEASKFLIEQSQAVILTGASETAKMFASWNPKLRLFAETSGKNSLIVTPSADVDLAVADAVYSAFGHSGQKCSAASLLISVGGAAEQKRFKAQLVDAVEGFALGQSVDLSTDLAPCVLPVEGNLLRALTKLDKGERWLVKPKKVSRDRQLWSPGVKIGVRPGSWFHQTECFGPVLGIIEVKDLDEAIKVQNGTSFGLTGGIHTLNHDEIKHWLDAVEVGNAYVNKPTTGAVVQRQPFGGWKQSNVGPGAKAGGPNYIEQLGTWVEDSAFDSDWLTKAKQSDREAWDQEFSPSHDPTGLKAERNIFRYVPFRNVMFVCGAETPAAVLERVRNAAKTCGCKLVEVIGEDDAALVARLEALATSSTPVERIILIGSCGPELKSWADSSNVYVDNTAPTSNGYIELRRFCKEQAISITNHRFGNFTNQLEF